MVDDSSISGFYDDIVKDAMEASENADGLDAAGDEPKTEYEAAIDWSREKLTELAESPKTIVRDG